MNNSAGGSRPALRARYRRIRSAAVGSGMGALFRQRLHHGPPEAGRLGFPTHLADNAGGSGGPPFGRVGDLGPADGANCTVVDGACHSSSHSSFLTCSWIKSSSAQSAVCAACIASLISLGIARGFDAQVAAISWEKLVATGPRSRQSGYLHVQRKLPMVSFCRVSSSRALQGGRG